LKLALGKIPTGFPPAVLKVAKRVPISHSFELKPGPNRGAGDDRDAPLGDCGLGIVREEKPKVRRMEG